MAQNVEMCRRSSCYLTVNSKEAIKIHFVEKGHAKNVFLMVHRMGKRQNGRWTDDESQRVTVRAPKEPCDSIQKEHSEPEGK